MKDKLVKRKRVKWFFVLHMYGSEQCKLDYAKFVRTHPGMSKNRCAWNVLKRHYSTTTLGTYRMFGTWTGTPLSERVSSWID